jgi:hypothetical protein
MLSTQARVYPILEKLSPRMRLPQLLLFLSVILSLAVRAEEPVALLKPGEALTYNVGWGPVGHAGEIKIVAQSEVVNGQPQLLVSTKTRTRGFIRKLLRFDGTAQTRFDARSGRLLSAAATTTSKKKNTQASMTLDYAKREIGYVDHLEPQRSSTLPLPSGEPMDMITALIQSRSWDLELGQSHDALVMFDNQFYPLTITAEREETITTEDGPRRALLLIPRMVGTPKGMFRKGGEVRVWVSTDHNRLPLRFEVRLKVGTAYATLSDYQSPAVLLTRR